MKLGVMAAMFGDMSLDQTLARCRKLGLEAIELPVGAYPGDPWKISGLHKNKAKVRELRQRIADQGMEIIGLAAHGNPVHPDKRIAKAHHESHRAAVMLAAELGTVVINFSGCPGGSPQDRTPSWITCPWPPEFTAGTNYQWDQVVIPYWTTENDFAKRHGVKIAFEAHPGMVVHTPQQIVRLRDAAGKQLGCNFDPSHFFWQGIDPLESVRYLGEHKCIYHVHAKDCRIEKTNAAIAGLLDSRDYSQITQRGWNFCTVGYGHGDEFWKPFVSLLRAYGYDGVLSIEHEDLLMSKDEGLEKAVSYLRNLLIAKPAAQAWWF